MLLSQHLEAGTGRVLFLQLYEAASAVWNTPIYFDKIVAERVLMQTKEQILKAIEELPDDATVDDALERIYLLYKIEEGLKQADKGQLITQAEVRERMAKWLK